MKLSLDALKEKAKEVATKEMLVKINGGTQDKCHRLEITYIGPMK